MFDDDDYWDDDDDITQDAVHRFEDMLEHHDNAYFDAEEFEAIIDYYVQINDLDNSHIAVDLAIEQHPDDINIRIKKARQLLLESNVNEAFALLNDTEINYGEPDYFLTLGSCYAAMGRSEEAIATYKKALLYFDEDEKSELYNAIGLENENLHQYKEAIEYYEKALLNSFDIHDLINGSNGLVNCCIKSKKIDEGVAFFNARIEDNPQQIVYWASLGDIYRRNNQLEEAIEMYEYVLAIEPTDLWANLHLADSYYDLNRFQEAIDSLQEALNHGLCNAIIYTSIGDCNLRMANFIDAIKAYRQALNINDTTVEAWSGLGYVYSDMGESIKAINHFKHAHNLEPYSEFHLYNLAAEYRKINDNDHALQCLLEIEQSGSIEPDLYYSIGEVLVDMNLPTEALSYLQKGIEQVEDNVILFYFSAYLYLELHERIMALNYLEQALQIDINYVSMFIDYNPEMITNDMEIMDLISRYQNQQ